MKNINHVIFETRFPILNNKYYTDLKDKQLYLKEYSLYNRLLLLYLLKNTSLKEYDEVLKNNKDYYLSVPEEDEQDMYQFLCNDILTYFYIRNNLFIENLSEEEKTYLDSLLDKEIEYNQDVEDFIKSTFSKVIFADIDKKGSKNRRYNLGPSDNQSFYVDNSSLVIGLRLELFVHQEEKDISKKYFAGLSYIDTLCEELKEKMSKELNYDVQVIQYSDSSVVKLDFMDKSILGK